MKFEKMDKVFVAIPTFVIEWTWYDVEIIFVWLRWSVSFTCDRNPEE